MNIIENLTPKEKEEPKSGIDDEFSFTVDSASAKSEVAEWNGQTVKTEELEQNPKVKDTDDGKVVELAKFKDDEQVTELEQNTIDISLADIREHPSFFTEEEREELSRREHHISEEDQQSLDRVQEALNDPQYPNTRQELWHELAKEEGKFGLGQEEELSEAEEDRKAVEALERQGYDVDYEHPDNREISNMTGSEFKQVMQDAMSEPEKETEELEQEPEPEEVEKTEITTLEEELAEPATEVWSEYGGVWEEFSEDIETESELPDTQVVSLGDGYREITTQFDELQVQLMELHNRENTETKVLDMKDDGTMVARAYEGDLD